MEENRAKDQARAQLDYITEMVTRLRHVHNCDGTDCTLPDETYGNMGSSGNETIVDLKIQYHDEEKAIQDIMESPLSVQYRSSWQNIGELLDPAEYNILMCTGGPAVRITGEYHDDKPRIEYQDWGTPWEELPITDDERLILADYVREFLVID